MIRSPAVANQFYPGSRTALTSALTELIPEIAPQEKKTALAVVSPHAGYIYSGGVAGETFGRVIIPENIVIMGPNHHGYGAPAALMNKGIWRMPLGDVPINEELATALTDISSIVEVDEAAHRHEHSLEVQVPFLQFLRKDITIVPLVISYLPYATCEKLGRDLAAAIKAFNKPVLIVASSDMTHYESRRQASAKDQQAIERILALDPAGLYQTVLSKRISMCGIMPTTIALVAAKEMGARQAELVRYTDSGETSGDTSQVVGYAGIFVPL